MTDLYQHDACPYCYRPSEPAEGVPDQALRLCPSCEHTWFEDFESPPRPAMLHTREPWYAEVNEIKARLPDGGEVVIAEVMGGEGARFIEQEVNAECAANRRRIVACVNACRHLTTEDLERPGATVELVQAGTHNQPAG